MLKLTEMKQLKINNSRKDPIMKNMITTAIVCMALISSAKTLDEVKAEYTDGTVVYSFRYDGTGSNRLRYDTVKLPSGKVTILVVEEPETGAEKKANKKVTVKEDDWTKNGSLVFATTNRHGIVRAVFQKNDEYVIKSKDLASEKKKEEAKKNKPVKATLLKAGTNIVKKCVWQYTNDDIKSYVENDPTVTNTIVKAAVRNTASTKLLGDAVSTNKSDKIRRRLARLHNRAETDGGYYIMSDDTVISYRDALNYGWANLPTNDIQQAVFDDVTSDPDSLWTKRVLFHDRPLDNKQNRTHRAGSKTFHIR